jgi:protein phosphatase 1 regulatory subunit 7
MFLQKPNLNLRTLDLSFNLLRSVPETLHHLQNLKTLYFVQNRISTISGLETLGATLTSLELGGNKIRVGSDLPLSDGC